MLHFTDHAGKIQFTSQYLRLYVPGQRALTAQSLEQLAFSWFRSYLEHQVCPLVDTQVKHVPDNRAANITVMNVTGSTSNNGVVVTFTM